MYIENIVIGEPIVSPEEIFAYDKEDWDFMEKEKTYYTDERYLPKILVALEIAPSISEIRRNRKDLMMNLHSLDYLELKYGKRRLFILVGN